MRWLVFLILLLAAGIFSFNNSTEVPLWIGTELPAQRVGLWMVLAFAVGGIIGLILGAGLFRRAKRDDTGRVNTRSG